MLGETFRVKRREHVVEKEGKNNTNKQKKTNKQTNTILVRQVFLTYIYCYVCRSIRFKLIREKKTPKQQQKKTTTTHAHTVSLSSLSCYCFLFRLAQSCVLSGGTRHQNLGAARRSFFSSFFFFFAVFHTRHDSKYYKTDAHKQTEAKHPPPPTYGEPKIFKPEAKYKQPKTISILKI